jgi:hypothetical protein
MKIGIKAKFAQISGRIFGDLFFGQGMTAGTQTAAVEDLTGAAIPTTPFQITPTVPNAGTWSRTWACSIPTACAMQRVASAPATGQYSVAAGVYTFAAADVGKTVYISFAYTYALASAKSVIFNNIAMGTSRCSASTCRAVQRQEGSTSAGSCSARRRSCPSIRSRTTSR